MQKFILSNGVKIGAFSVGWFLLLYLLGTEYVSNGLLLTLGSVITLILVIYFSIRYRKLNGGYISFKDAFLVTFGMFAVAGILSSLFNLILFNVIDPKLGDDITEATMKEMAEAFEKHLSEKQMDQMLDEMEKGKENYKPLGILKGYGYYLLGTAVVAAIIALFVKKNKPFFDEPAGNEPDATVQKINE